MKKIFLVIVCLSILAVFPVLAEEPIVEDSVLENIVYPYINYEGNEILKMALEALQKNKIGNPLTLTQYHQLKMKTIEETKITQTDFVVMKLAEINKGYYLKITLIPRTLTDKGYFELYNPETSELICSVTSSSITGPPRKVINNLIQSGIEKLYVELKEIKPELIIEPIESVESKAN